MAPLLSHTHAAAQTFAPVPLPRGDRRPAPRRTPRVFFAPSSRPARRRPRPTSSASSPTSAAGSRPSPTPPASPTSSPAWTPSPPPPRAPTPSLTPPSSLAPGASSGPPSRSSSSSCATPPPSAPPPATCSRSSTVPGGTLNNVITFPPSGAFVVNGAIEIQPPQRVNFRQVRAALRGSNWEVPFPPFGKGWFDTVYVDDDIRVAKDIRGDYLVVERAPYSWSG